MKMKIKKLAARIGVGILFLIALALFIRAVFNFTSGKKLEDLLQSMRNEGIPLTLEEIEHECAASDNAAISWKAAEAVFTLEDIKEQRELLGDTIQNIFSRQKLDDEKKEKLEGIIDGQKRALQFLMEASTKPCFKYEDNWDEAPSSMKIPDLVKLIQLFRVHGVDAYLTAERGQIEEGVEKVFSGIHFLEVYLQEPFLINYLAAVANMKVLLVYLQRIAEDFPLSHDLQKRIIERLDPVPWRKGLLLDFSAERIYAIEAAFTYLKGKLDIDERKFIDKISIWLFKPFFKSGIAKFLGTYNKYEESLSLPYFEARDTWKVVTEDFDKPFTNKIMKLLFPDFTVVMFKETTLEAMLQSIRLGLGCRLYREESGTYPENLEQLAPGIMNTVPVDPFTGKAFIYRHEDTGLIIYSIGNNMRDDQGRGTWLIPKLVLEKDDDWAWKESFLK